MSLESTHDCSRRLSIKARSNLFPLQQGDLDFLCCLYAVVNLLYRHGRASTIELAGEHFARILHKLPDLEWNITAFATRGVNPDGDVIELLKVAGFQGHEIRPDNLADACAANPEGVLVFCEQVGGVFDHYTLVTAVSSSGELTLFDSYGFSRALPKGTDFTLSEMTVKVVKAWQITT